MCVCQNSKIYYIPLVQINVCISSSAIGPRKSGNKNMQWRKKYKGTNSFPMNLISWKKIAHAKEPIQF